MPKKKPDHPAKVSQTKPEKVVKYAVHADEELRAIAEYVFGPGVIFDEGRQNYHSRVPVEMLPAMDGVEYTDTELKTGAWRTTEMYIPIVHTTNMLERKEFGKYFAEWFSGWLKRKGERSVPGPADGKLFVKSEVHMSFGREQRHSTYVRILFRAGRVKEE